MRLTSKGLRGAISMLAVATCEDPDDGPRDLFPAIRSHYMQKMAAGSQLAGTEVRLDMLLEQILDIVAEQFEKRVGDLVFVTLDRPRHGARFNSLRQVSCGIRLVSDGDVVAAITASLPNSGVDL